MGKGGKLLRTGEGIAARFSSYEKFLFLASALTLKPPTSPRDPFPLRLALQRELISNYGVARGAGGCACRRFVIGAKGCACVCVMGVIGWQCGG